MVELLKRFLAAIAGSKKAVAAIATVIFVFLAPQLARVGLEVTKQEIEAVVLIVVAYLAGQGLSDIGKERAKIEAAAKNGGKLPGVTTGEIG